MIPSSQTYGAEQERPTMQHPPLWRLPWLLPPAMPSGQCVPRNLFDNDRGQRRGPVDPDELAGRHPTACILRHSDEVSGACKHFRIRLGSTRILGSPTTTLGAAPCRSISRRKVSPELVENQAQWLEDGAKSWQPGAIDS